MALKDCIKKMKRLVSAEDVTTLEQYIEDGLSDEQAVRKLLIGASQNVIQLAARARTEGAKLTDVTTPLAKVAQFREERQGRALGKLAAERTQLASEAADLTGELSDIGIVNDRVAELGGTETDEQILNGLTAILFGNKNLKQKAVFGLKGGTPLELLASYKKLQQRQGEIQQRLAEIATRLEQIEAESEQVFSPTKTLYQTKRGSITFDKNNKAIIRMTKARNLSTFLHESAHLYLELLGDLSEMTGSPQQTREDFAKALEFLGVKDRSEITSAHHERWAESFEVYLREGKAPTLGLESVFQSFRAWLLSIYRSLAKLKNFGGLNDEVRGVFDRIIATDAQVAEAARVQEYAALFATAEDMGVSQEVYDAYKQNIIAAHQQAVDDASAQAMRYMQRQSQQWWADEKKKMSAQVRTEAEAMPVYRALAMLQRGTNPDGTTAPDQVKFKLSRDDLVKRFGKAFVARLPRPWVYSVKGGVDVDVAAQVFAFDGAVELVEALIKAPKMEAWIAAETEARMASMFPDPLVDGSIANEAVRVVHNEKRAQILAAEMRALRRRLREDRKIIGATKRQTKREERQAREANKGQLPRRGELALIKQAARRFIDAKKIRDINPHKYLIAERKAGRAAFGAMETKDYQKAYDQKRKQVESHELYRAAVRAKDRHARTQAYLKKFDKIKVRQRLGKAGMLEKIDAVLEGINLRKISGSQIDREEAMAEIIAAIDDGRLMAPPSLIAALQDTGTNWQNLTSEEFDGIRDLVMQLEKEASAKYQVIVDGERVDLQQRADEIASSMYENNAEIDIGVARPTVGESAKLSVSEGIAAWLRPGSLARMLDKSGFGALTRLIVVPIREAYAKRLLPGFRKMEDDVSQIYQRHYSLAELGDLYQRGDVIPGLGKLSKSDILSIALNWGNEGNRKALLGGIKNRGGAAYSEQGVVAALATLDQRDWAFVQDMWDYLDTYWDDLSDAAKRRRGIAPQKVEALPFSIRTSDGAEILVKGGYYPLRYDRRHTRKGGRAAQKNQELEDLMQRMTASTSIFASTRAGSTYERVKNHGNVIRLGLDTINFHLREIIRDIAIGDEINYVKRLLDHDDVRDSFTNTGNEKALEAFNLWLTDSAIGELAAEGVVEQSAAWIRTGFTKSKLAFNMVVMLLQYTGILQTIAVIGSQAYGHGVGRMMKNPKQAYIDVMSMSSFMKTRYVDNTWNKDVSDTRAHLESMFGPAPTGLKRSMNALSATYFLPIMAAQSVVDVSTWLGAYWKAQNIEGLNQKEAIQYADVQVENAQTSGFFSDRSGLERGTLGTKKNRQSQFIRIWTVLLSYMLAKGNIAYEKTKTTDFTKPGQVAAYTFDLFLLFTVEAVASAWLYGRLPDDDDDEPWGWWLAKATVDSAFSGVPFVREIAAAKYGGGNTPIGSFSNDLYKLVQQAAQGEADEQFRRVAVNVIGTGLHLPASQTNRFIDVVWSEDDTEVYEWLLGERD